MEKLAIALLGLLVAIWVGAKVHFFTRFGATTMEGYILEHWPFWAAMALVSVLLFVVGAIARRTES